MTNTPLDVSKALIDHIWNCLKEDPQVKTLVAGKDQIALLPPKQASKSAKASIYPYLIALTATARNPPAAADADEKTPMPPSFMMKYLVTPCSGELEDDLLLLGKVIQAAAVMPLVAASSNCGELKIVQDTLSLEEVCNLWIALGEPLKPCASFTVSLGASRPAEAETNQAAKANPQTMELYKAVFNTFSQNLEEWKHRNMIQRQYVMMDFSKNADMSADVMLMELRSLGERLENNRPIEPCLAALKKLEEYYDHQGQMLRGFEKVQKKRQEGIDMVAKWKGEVTALRQALEV